MTKFQDKYGFEKTFEELDTAGRATAAPFKHLDSFLNTSTGISYESMQYLRGLMYMLNKYVDDKLAPEMDSKKNYSLGNLDVMEFVKEYENIAQMKHEMKNSGTPRQPYEGIEVKVLKSVADFAKNLNKPLVDVWADKIENGTYSVSDLKEKTKLAANMGGEAHIKTVAMIHGAMQKIAEERSIGWKLNPLNWPRMFSEYRYRNELSSTLERNMEKFFNVREALTEDKSNLVMDAKVSENIDKLRAEREKEIQIQREKELQDKREKESADKTKLTVDEAATNFSKDVEKQPPHHEAPTKDLTNTRV